MAGPSFGGPRRSVAFGACLVAIAALLTGSPAASKGMRNPFRVLQMNLCNSGLAGCYTGRSVTEAAAVIRADSPDVVTLNEVCQADVYALGRTMADLYSGAPIVRAFKAAPDRRTASATRCRNGQPYGIGLLAHIPASYRGHTTYSGIYPTQDTGDPERRAWLCVYATAHFYACTTHLASTSSTIALAQCGYLLNTAIPAVRTRGGYEPTVLGGDLNLRYGGSADVRSCVPSRFPHRHDGAAQHVVATTDFTVSSSRLIGMDGTTDHPSLLVALTAVTGAPHTPG
jgi:endonuclease/exonuclease/phosphatase family metal-dependent hydrolase